MENKVNEIAKKLKELSAKKIENQLKEIKDIDLFVSEISKDKKYIGVLSCDNQLDLVEFAESVKYIQKYFEKHQIDNIALLAIMPGTTFTMYELEREKKKNDIKSKTRARLKNSR